MNDTGSGANIEYVSKKTIDPSLEKFADYKKKFNFKKYEMTLCFIYEMHIRAEGIKLDYEKVNNTINETPYSELPRIKDILIYNSNEKKISLQEIIYNIYPDLYTDTIIWIIQYKIMEELIKIKSNLKEVSINNKSYHLKLDEIIELINPHKNRLYISDFADTQNTIDKLYKKKKKLQKLKTANDFFLTMDNNSQINFKTLINKTLEKFDIDNFDTILTTMSILNKKITEVNIHSKYNNYSLLINQIDNSIDNIINYIEYLNYDIENFIDCNNYSSELIDNFNDNINNHLNFISFPVDYLKINYLNNENKIFNKQIIKKPDDNGYIKITKKFLTNLIDKYINNNTYSLNYSRPIHELQNLGYLDTVHNINLSVPKEELLEFTNILSESYFNSKELDKNKKYILNRIYKKESIECNVENHLTNEDSLIKILYIYDSRIEKPYLQKDVERLLNIGSDNYRLFKDIGIEYITNKRYKELYTN